MPPKSNKLHTPEELKPLVRPFSKPHLLLDRTSTSSVIKQHDQSLSRRARQINLVVQSACPQSGVYTCAFQERSPKIFSLQYLFRSTAGGDVRYRPASISEPQIWAQDALGIICNGTGLPTTGVGRSRAVRRTLFFQVLGTQPARKSYAQ